jgi:hypothetical protein
MIKFFRSLRNTYLNEGSIKKYFLYAIGEIFLVVLGILIALQINNWNEAKKESNLENIYYCRILEEFELDKSLITQSYEQVNQKIETGKQIIIDLHKGKPDKHTILNNYLKALRLAVYVPRKNAFNDLTSSGNLKILSDVTTKNSLMEYYGNLENILRQMNQNRDELVRRSYPEEPALFGIQEFDYMKTSLGKEIFDLLPDEDWISDKTHKTFLKFQDNLLFILTMYERHKHHLNSIIDEMEKPYELLKNHCQS